MRIIISILSLICVMNFSLMEAGCANINEEIMVIQLYYKNPTYANFENCLKVYDALINQLGLQRDVYTLNNATLFTAQILEDHPEFIELYATNLGSQPFLSKAIFLRAIRSTKKQHPLLGNIKDRKLKSMVYSKNLQFLTDVIPISEPGDIDTVWSLYFANGDIQYIQQLMEIINSDERMLFLSYEVLNRKMQNEFLEKLGFQADLIKVSDIKKRMEFESKRDKNFLPKCAIVHAAFWSLEANARQDSAVKEKIQQVIEKNPSLDYWKRIGNMLRS